MFAEFVHAGMYGFSCLAQAFTHMHHSCVSVWLWLASGPTDVSDRKDDLVLSLGWCESGWGSVVCVCVYVVVAMKSTEQIVFELGPMAVEDPNSRLFIQFYGHRILNPARKRSFYFLRAHNCDYSSGLVFLHTLSRSGAVYFLL